MIDLVHEGCRIGAAVSPPLDVPITPELASAITRWGYAAVAVGVFFEGETILIVAGAMAHKGLLSLPAVIAAALAGSLAGDQLWFHLGQRYGRGFIARRPALSRRAARAEELLSRFGTLFVISFRFLYGFRTITPILLGVMGYAAGRYTVLNAIGAALWATAFGIAGYALGASLMGILGRATHLQEVLLAVVALAAVLWLLSRAFCAAIARTKKRQPSR